MMDVCYMNDFIEAQRQLLKVKLLCDMSEEDQLSLPEVDEFVNKSVNTKAHLGQLIKKLLLVSFSLSNNVMVCNGTETEQPETEKRLMLMMTKMMTGVQDTLLSPLSKVDENLTVFRPEVTAKSLSTVEEPQEEEPEPKKKYQLLVENESKVPFTKNSWSVIESGMKIKMVNVKVDRVSLTQNGRITMKVPDEASVAQKTEVLQEAGYKVTDISKTNKPTLLPKIRIIDEVKDQAKNRELKKKKFVEALMVKNESFRTFMEKRSREQVDEESDDKVAKRQIDYDTLGFKVIYMDKNGGSVIVVVSPEVRQFLKSIGDKLYLGYRACKVFNHFRLTQCYKCQSFGHKSATCSAIREVFEL